MSANYIRNLSRQLFSPRGPKEELFCYVFSIISLIAIHVLALMYTSFKLFGSKAFTINWPACGLVVLVYLFSYLLSEKRRILTLILAILIAMGGAFFLGNQAWHTKQHALEKKSRGY